MFCRLSGVLWNERRCFVHVTCCEERSGSRRCVQYGRKTEWRLWRDDGIYILEFLQFLDSPCCIGSRTQNGAAFILRNHMAPQDWEASKRDGVLAVRTVHYAGRCVGIWYHFDFSDLVHLGAYWVVRSLSQLCNHLTWLPIPSSGKSTCNWCHRIENKSLFHLQWF